MIIATLLPTISQSIQTKSKGTWIKLAICDSINADRFNVVQQLAHQLELDLNTIVSDPETDSQIQ